MGEIWDEVSEFTPEQMKYLLKRARKKRLDCPCCGAFNDHGITTTDRYGNVWDRTPCRDCGVEYQQSPMSDADRAAFYSSGEYRRLCEQVTGKPWTDEGYLKTAQIEYAWRWSRLSRYFAEGKWLDYGGDTGRVSDELNAHIVDRGFTRRQAAVVVADYGEGRVKPEDAWILGPYDAILCCQTLDHLREPLQTLKQFREVAKDGARVFVDVVKKSCTEFKCDHDTYYPSAHSFVSLVERAGWSIVWLDCETNPTHYSILAEKVNGTR